MLPIDSVLCLYVYSILRGGWLQLLKWMSIFVFNLHSCSLAALRAHSQPITINLNRQTWSANFNYKFKRTPDHLFHSTWKNYWNTFICKCIKYLTKNKKGEKNVEIYLYWCFICSDITYKKNNLSIVYVWRTQSSTSYTYILMFPNYL